jgi:hypothetical protein
MFGIENEGLDATRERVGRTRIHRVPAVAELLEIDREYRRKAAAGALTVVAPRRCNPERRAWLPILHTERGDRHYSVLFSNTERAHELGRTHDWVVIFVDDGVCERQATIVTEWRGVLAGRRVVRGHEAECRAYYAALDPKAYGRACVRAHVATRRRCTRRRCTPRHATPSAENEVRQ